MADLLIDIDDDLIAFLSEQATKAGLPLEEYVRAILTRNAPGRRASTKSDHEMSTEMVLD